MNGRKETPLIPTEQPNSQRRSTPGSAGASPAHRGALAAMFCQTKVRASEGAVVSRRGCLRSPECSPCHPA